jgi:Sulfotransferase family
MPRPIFLTGLARGGTNLLARMLIAGGACRIAIHAFQPWFKSLRNALVAHHATAEIQNCFDPESPFGDGHFDDRQLAVQQFLHGAPLDVPFASEEWPQLLQRLQSRAADDAADLLPGLVELAGAKTFCEMMQRILALVGRGYEHEAKFVGLIDTWIIDLLPALARAFPDARFLIVIRDPRGLVASALKFLDIDPTQVGHVLSILRQWRKYVVFAHEFQRQALFAGRLKFVRYEDEVNDPDQFARGLCDFLDLRYRSAMLDFSLYEDQARRRRWQGNSAFEAELQRIDPGPAQRWRRTLSPDALAAIEFCCGLDMEVCGYVPVNPFDRLTDNPRSLAFLAEDGKRNCAWRTDTGDAEVEYGREALRRRLLVDRVRPSDEALRRAFLSPAYFDLIRSRGRLFLNNPIGSDAQGRHGWRL